MIKNYLLISVRRMMKDKAFILINVFGMGIAIGCAIVAFLAFQYDAKFDRVHQNRASIFRINSVREFDGKLTRVGYSPLPLGEIVDKTFSDVDLSSRYVRSGSNFKLEDDLFSANLSYVDPEFFKMFTFDFIAGSATDIYNPTSVVISEEMAVRLFGSVNEALNKNITQVYGVEKAEVKVSGVFSEPPANSSFHMRNGSAYMNFLSYKNERKDARDDDWTKESTVFLQVNDASLLPGIQARLQPFTENNNKVREDFLVKKFELESFATMAYNDRDHRVRSWTWGAPPSSAIIGSVVMAILLLLIACFNLTNTAIAISSQRLKEIGIRKVMGSMRLQLMVQFISETTLVCLLAVFVGLGFADLLIEGWNLMTGNNIFLASNYLQEPSFILFVVAMLLTTGLIAGSYPAFYISKFEPVTILKGKLRFGGTNYLTRTLLVLQFSFSLIAIVCAIGFYQNSKYQREYDLGFDVRGTIVAYVNNESEFDTYRNALEQNPDILSVSGAESGIFSSPSHEAVKHQSSSAEVDVIAVGDNYLKTMDLKLIEGRDFIKDSKTDQKESVIITQKMADLFNWDKAVGKQILWRDTINLYIVGVVKDVYTRGLWREMEPMMIRVVPPDHYTQIVVSTKAENVAAVNADMNAQWNKVFPARLYNGDMLITELQRVVDLNLSTMYVYMFLAFIAMLLSATGLFTLLSLNIIKRMKEIGVRKVLGASVGNISRIVNTEFVIVLLVASVLGASAGYSMSTAIMSSIWKYYQGVSALTLILAVGVLLSISFITIFYKVFNLVSINPVDTLKDE